MVYNTREVSKKTKKLLRPGIELETMHHTNSIVPLGHKVHTIVVKPIHECMNLTKCKMVQICHIVFPAHVTCSRV